MFILTEKDIQYCQVASPQSSVQKSHLGVFYRGFLFFQVGSYKKNQLQIAIESCRRFLEKDTPITSIIVKNNEKVTLWCENEQLHLVTKKSKSDREEPAEEIICPKTNTIKYRGQEVIREAKKQVTHLELNKQKKTRRYRGRTY
ncbi:MAG: hypothetical protein QNJ38_03300 [Prochloraceae cyanobacterium]|nr:hypothetical protein [Prochloraceae cyanobacterium]